MELALIAGIAFAALVLVAVGIVVGRRHGAGELIDRAVIVVETRCAQCGRVVGRSHGKPVIKADTSPTAA